MSFHNLFFKGIDFCYEGRQNRRRCTKFAGVQFSVISDIVYDSSDPSVCRLDICKLSGAEGLPVIFYLHGGGFEAGDKHHRRALARWFATLGYAVVNVNYGLAPGCRFPAQHRQIASALCWLHQNAANYGLDISRTVVAGDSAGAYYASFLACLAAQPELCQKLGVRAPVKFGAALLNCGVYDMHLLATQKMLFNLGKYVFCDTTGASPAGIAEYEWRELCDIPSLVTPDFPPCMVIYSCKDILCKNQHTKLLPALRANGVPFREFSSVKLRDNHCFSLMWKGRAAKLANAAIADFLTKFKNGEQPV